MYQSSAAFADLIQSDSRTFKSKLLLNGTEMQTNIKKINLKGGSNTGTSFVIGNCVSQYIEVEMTKPSVFVENKELEWKIGASITANMEEYIPMGFYTAGKPESDEEQIKFTAFDRMSKTDKTYFSTLATTTTTLAIIKEISEFLGIPVITTGLSSVSMKRPEGYTCREVLSYIAQMYAGFAICNRQGQIEIRRYEWSGINIDKRRYWDTFKHNDFPYTFQKITCITGEDEGGNPISISAGSGNREMTISNPFMVQSTLNTAAATLKGFSYMAGSLRFLGDPRIDPWDIITVVGRDGINYNVPTMSYTQEYDGGLTTTVESVSESETEEQQGFKGPTAQAIDRVSVKLALVDHAVVNKLDVNTANITFAKITDLDAINGKFSTLDTIYFKAAEAEILKTKIGQADIALANIENILGGNAGIGDITNIHLTSQNAVLESALIKSAVMQSTTVNDLLAGTIYTSKFQIWSDELGGMRMFGATQQWRDKVGLVRMQAGLDAAGVFNYYIVDSSGNTMFDALNGVSTNGIKAPIIKDSMVADDANINGNKVDVHTLTQNINGSNVQILGSKVVVDGTNQTVSVKFDKLEEEINGVASSAGGYTLQTFVEGGHTGDGETAVIQASLYLNNKDVTKDFAPGNFVWQRLSEDDAGDDAWNAKQKTGYSLELSGSDVTMVASFECIFYIWDEDPITDFLGNGILDFTGNQIIGLRI